MFQQLYIKLMPKSGKIYIDVYKTQKNKPLREELKKMPFIVSEDEEYARFSFDKSNGEFVRDEIINVNQLQWMHPNASLVTSKVSY